MTSSDDLRPRLASPFLAMLLCVGIVGSARGQVHELWMRTHDAGAATHQDDIARAIAVAPNGDVHVSGDSATLGGVIVPHTYFVDTLTYNAAGNELWSARFTPVPNVRMHVWGLALSPQGDTYVAAGSANSQPYLLKYSVNGSLLWSRAIANPQGNPALALIVDSSGDIFLGGSDVSSAGYFPGIAKIDPAGNIVWSTHLLPLPPDSGGITALAVAPNGDIVGTGWVAPPGGAGSADVMAMRVDSAGNVMWARFVDGSAGLQDQGNAVAVDGAGNTYVAGFFNTNFPGYAGDQAVLAWDPNGVLSWTKEIDGTGNGYDEMIRIGVDPFGRIVATGTTTTATLDFDVSVSVFDALGNSVWSRSYDNGSHGFDHASAMALDAAGNIHVAGITELSGAGAALSIGYDPTGELRYTEIVPLAGATSNVIGFDAVAVAPSGAIALTGATTGHDFLTVLLERTAVPYCFGDGSGTACPCGNASAPVTQSGCSSSFGIGGRLIDSGASSLSADTLVLNGTNMPSSTCLYFQGTSAVASGAGGVFGDGLRCAGGTVVRLATKQNTNGQSQYPQVGDTSVSVRGNVTSPGDRNYQVWYRNSAPFCTSATFNLTNGLRVTWVP